MNIKKNELVQQLVQKHGYTKTAATSIIEDFTDIILENLGDGNTVSLYGFGCFDILERAARSCPNPQTNEKCHIPAHWIPRFYPGTSMRRAVKVWEDNSKRGLA